MIKIDGLICFIWYLFKRFPISDFIDQSIITIINILSGSFFFPFDNNSIGENLLNLQIRQGKSNSSKTMHGNTSFMYSNGITTGNLCVRE